MLLRYKRLNMENKKGFTLIELLVVIAIIGLLATIVLVSLNTARGKARDSRRKADLNQLVLAIQMYAGDNNGKYPGEGWCDSSTGTCSAACPCGDDDWTSSSGIYTGLVGGGYISTLPIDPVNNNSYFYDYEPDCNQGKCPSPKGCCYFRLTARLEQGGIFRLEGY